MRCIVLLFLIVNVGFFYAQKSDLKSQLLESYINSSTPKPPNQKRRLMYLNEKGVERIGLVKAGFSGLMYLYQNIISEQINAACMYEISCSEYTKRQIEKNGLIIGSVKGFHQLMHCTHGAIEEVPPFMKSNYSTKIINSVD